jgi:hypothetical protein
MTIGVYFQLAVQFVHSLLHSGQADASFRARFTKPIQTLCRYATAIVSYFQNHRFKLALKADTNLRSSRVPMYIRQALLEDTKENNLHAHWQSFLVGRNVQAYLYPTSLGKALDVPFRRARESSLIQQRWMQQVGHGSDFLDCLIRQLYDLGDKGHFGRVLLAAFLKKPNVDF